MEITLKELCGLSGVTRRAVQGYERAGLLRPAGRNKYGHLLYGPDAPERLRRIRFLQDLGFTVRQIAQLENAPPRTLHDALAEKLTALQRRQKSLEILAARTRAWLDELNERLQKEDKT